MQELIHDTTKVYIEAEKMAAWNKASTTVKKYSDELVEQWNREIDGLLTFVSISLYKHAIFTTTKLKGRRVSSPPF